MAGPGKIKIPLPNMGIELLERLFPHLTQDQLTAIKAGRPVPASPDFTPAAGKLADADILKQLAILRKRFITLYGANALEPWLMEWFWRNPPTLKTMPKIAVIMLVRDQHTPILVARGMRQFVQQNYPNKQMILLKSAGYDGPIDGHQQIKVVPLTPMGLAAARNEGLKHCDADYIAPFWDCDDLYHPWYLSVLMSPLGDTDGSVLEQQVRMSVVEPLTTVLHAPLGGLPNTLLYHRAGSLVDLTFDEDAPDEETTFVEEFRQHARRTRISVITAPYPLNLLRVGVHHLASPKTFEEYFPQRTRGEQCLDIPEQTYAHLLLASVGLTVKPSEPVV